MHFVNASQPLFLCILPFLQTVGGDLQLEMARTVGAAVGRYMHVMWPENTHEPGLELTAALLRWPLGAGWAARAFYSDDGSTAVEVAIKMAFRRYMADHGLLEDDEQGSKGPSEEPPLSSTQQQQAKQPGNQRCDQQQQQQQQQRQRQRPLHVLALHNNYHGDTLGAMDCAAASAFNGRLQTPWYTERGLYLEPPYLSLERGKWRLQLPAWLHLPGQQGEDALTWANRESAFCPARSR